jgi:hypothetical protein
VEPSMHDAERAAQIAAAGRAYLVIRDRVVFA